MCCFGDDALRVQQYISPAAYGIIPFMDVKSWVVFLHDELMRKIIPETSGCCCFQRGVMKGWSREIYCAHKNFPSGNKGLWRGAGRRESREFRELRCLLFVRINRLRQQFGRFEYQNLNSWVDVAANHLMNSRYCRLKFTDAHSCGDMADPVPVGTRGTTASPAVRGSPEP